MDDLMPGLSGTETMTLIKKIERIDGYYIPIVAVTANATSGQKEKYLENGDLELQNSPFSAEDRKRAGEHLAKDFYLGNYNKLQSVSLLKIASGNNGRDDALIYKEAYLNAIKRIPNEFWPAVRIVCIEDKELKADKNIIPHSLRSKQIVFHLKSLLVLGLERLVKYYLQKNEKSS